LDIESPAEGFVKQVLAKEGETLKVGMPMLIIGSEHDEINVEIQGSAEKPEQQVSRPSSVAGTAEVSVKPSAAKKTGRIFASPRAKAKAKKLGVDLSSITGTGPDGRIVEVNVLTAGAGGSGTKAKAEQPPSQYKPGQRVPLNRLGKIVKQRMLQSKREIPCFYLNVKVDVTDMVKVRAELNKSGNVKIAFNDFIMRAIALGFEQYPIMTGQIEGDDILLADSIGIGIAIAVPEGLVAPIVKDVGRKTLAQIATYSQSLIERAQNNKLSTDDLEGGCITLSNLGALGIDSFIPIVVPGQCSILGVGKIADTCVPTDGGILVRKIMNMTLSVDHKVVNGAAAAEFLDFVAKLLAEPKKLV
jgi:pyruvate dehydrogenase E2 component (dihydrolipoamide acetyltransferase)